MASFTKYGHHWILNFTQKGAAISSSVSGAFIRDQIVQALILQFFNTDKDHYSVIFTQNASAAIKIVSESFPYEQSSILGLLSDNHNSVLGIF